MNMLTYWMLVYWFLYFLCLLLFFFFQAEDGIRDPLVTGVQTCALPISPDRVHAARRGGETPARGVGGAVGRVLALEPHQADDRPDRAGGAAPVDAAPGTRIHRRRDDRCGARARARRARARALLLRRAGRRRAHRSGRAALLRRLPPCDRGARRSASRIGAPALRHLGEALGARAALHAAAERAGQRAARSAHARARPPRGARRYRIHDRSE